MHLIQRGSALAVVLTLLFVSSVFVGAASGVADSQSPEQIGLIDLWGSSPSFDVSITASETAAGNNTTAAVTVTNTGDQAGSTELTISDETTTLNTTNLRLDSDASTTITVERETTVDDIGTINLTAATPETTATTAVTIVDPEPPTVTAIRREPTTTNDTVRVNATFEQGSVPIETARLELVAEFSAFTRSVPVETPVDDNGNAETTFEVAELPADGSYTPRAVATGPVGQSDTNTAAPVIVDTTPPELQLATANLTDTPSLTIDPNEPVVISDGGITITNATGVDRSPDSDALPDGVLTDAVTLPFAPVATGENETVTATVTATDEAGNRNTQTLTATVTPYTISADGTAAFEPTDDTSATVNTAGVVDGGERTAVVQRSDTAPPGTRLTPTQVGAGFLTVSESGLTDAELTNATVTIELDGVRQETVNSFENSSLRVLRSADGDSVYQPVETTYNETDHTVTTTVDEFGQFAVAGIDTTEPSITTTNVAPGRTVSPTAGSVTVAYEYSDTQTGVDLDETALIAAVDGDRTTTQIEPTAGRIEIGQLTAGETITVGLNVTDAAGNSHTTVEQIRVAGDDVETGSATDRNPPSIEQLHNILRLVGPERTAELPLADAESTADGLTVRIDDAETVSAIRFTDDSLDGRLSVAEYGTPPQPIADDIVEAAARDIDGVQAGTEYGEQTAGLTVRSVVDITSTATANTSATVELTVDNSTVENPERLTVLTATDQSATQRSVWQQREPTITDRGDGEITLQLPVDSFSLFAIVETDGDTQQIGTSDTETGDDRSGGHTLLAVVAAGIVGALLVAILLARRRRSRDESNTELEVDPEDTEFEWNPLEDS